VKKTLAAAVLVTLAFALPGLAEEKAPALEPDKPQPIVTPDRIQVQHILVAFKGRLPGKNVTRSLEEARTLAESLLARAKGGEDFGDLVKEFSDDSFPGMYGMANTGVKPVAGEYARSGMVGAFGDVGFSLQVGEIGMTGFDEQKSPYGFHIIKRIK